MAPSGAAEPAVVPVAAVCRPAGDGGRVLRFDRALGQRGMAAAAGTRRRGGNRWRRACRHCRWRRMRRCRMAALGYQVRLAGPGLLGRHRARPGRRRRNPRLPRSRGTGVQPETGRHHQRPRERHGPAPPAPRKTSGRHPWLTRRRQGRPGAAAEPGPRWPATPAGLPPATPAAAGRPRRTPRPAARGRPRRPWRCRGCAPARRSRRRTRRTRRARSPRMTVSLIRVRSLTGATLRPARSRASAKAAPMDTPRRHSLAAPRTPAARTRFRAPQVTRSPPRTGRLVLLAASRPVSRPPGRPPPSRPRRPDSPKTRPGLALRSR